MKKRKGVNMTLAQADAHQRKHGFKPLKEYEVQSPASSKSPPPKGKLRNVRKRQMNRTEREFHILLLEQASTAQIKDVRFEGVRLLWGGGMTYTPDFSARRADGRIVLHECKGEHIRDRDVVRFKGCRHEWQEWFDFEFHQRHNDGTWTRLL